MIKRVLAMAEIKERIEAARVALGIKTFHQNLQRGLKGDELTALCVSEGADEIVKRTSRNPRGLPQDRFVEIIIDLVAVKSELPDIRKRIIDTREVILVDIYPVKFEGVNDTTTFLSELRIEGPFGYGLPNVEGIRLVLGLNYIDSGSY